MAWDTILDDIFNNCTDLNSKISGNWTHLAYYQTHYDAGDYHLALDELRKICQNLNDAFANNITMYFHGSYVGYFPYVAAINIPAGEVTWESIIEAWVKDDYKGRTWTIGVIDRMRQILWNEPFDLTFAARPEDKEF